MIGELNQSDIDSLLHSEPIGRIGCYANGQLYIVPVAFAYDGKSIYGHTDEGRKLRMLRADPRVCFEVDRIDTPANWRSVIIWGTFEELVGEDADKAWVLLRNKLEPLVGAAAQPDSQGYLLYRMQTAAKHGIMYRINPSHMTGRFETYFETYR